MIAAALLVAAAAATAVAFVRGRRPTRDEPEPGPRRGAGWARLGEVPLPAGLSARLTPPDAALRLRRAGLDDVPPRALAGARAVSAVSAAAPCLLLGLVWPPGVLFTAVLGIIGLLLPGRLLRQAARRRAGRIRAALPGALDLLSICVGGGMSLDPALASVARHTPGPLGAEIRETLEDIRVGTPRAAAYASLAERAPCPEVGRVVGALRQSEELGAPLAPALESQAREVRDAMRRAAAEHAATSAPRIQLVTALVLVPAAMLLIVAALVVQLAEHIGAAIGGVS